LRRGANTDLWWWPPLLLLLAAVSLWEEEEFNFALATLVVSEKQQ
jgi:hypothetical protein